MILLKSAAEIEKIRTASKYAMEVLLELKRSSKEGVRTSDLEAACEGMVKKRGN